MNEEDFVFCFKSSFVLLLTSFCFVSDCHKVATKRTISFISLSTNQLLKDLIVITYSTVL